jgi:signal recognition particle subunit SRP14
MADSDGAREYPCLVRATNGKEAKFSTHVRPCAVVMPHRTDLMHHPQVQPRDLDKFHAAYGALLKVSMTTLRKRDKKREKQRAEEATARKRKVAEPISVEGAKRGAGRRKRQRKAKAAVKNEEMRKRLQEREEKAAKAGVANK